jgi:hypothetical protein
MLFSASASSCPRTCDGTSTRPATDSASALQKKRRHEEQGKDAAVVVLGDFNDEPFSRSITEYALAPPDAARVGSARSQNSYLLNLMWPIVASGHGTHFYDGWNTLDQIMVSRGIVTGTGGWKVRGEAKVEATTIMGSGANQAPKRFGIKPKERDTDGFSEHFPVSIVLI